MYLGSQSHATQLFVDEEGLTIFLPGLALNLSPPYLHFLSSLDYKHEPLHPATNNCTLEDFSHRNGNLHAYINLYTNVHSSFIYSNLELEKAQKCFDGWMSLRWANS
jgi:hypothetical protein